MATRDPGFEGRTASLDIGVIVRRQPGVTRWAKWTWRAVGVIPGAPPANWHEMRRDGEAVEYHAATVTMTVHRTDTEAYRVALSNEPPSIYVILRTSDDPDSPHEIEVAGVTASAYEAQDYLDSGEEMVEPVPMPPELIAWLSSFVAEHHREEVFVKRKRRQWSAEAEEDGRGDARVRQDADVYRAPGSRRGGTVH